MLLQGLLLSFLILYGLRSATMCELTEVRKQICRFQTSDVRYSVAFDDLLHQDTPA